MVCQPGWLKYVAVGIEGAGNFHHPRGAILAGLFPLHRFDTVGQVADDDMELRIGLGVELAVLHDKRDLRVDIVCQGIVPGRRELAGVGGRQCFFSEGADRSHAMAQRIVGAPLLAGIEFD